MFLKEECSSDDLANVLGVTKRTIRGLAEKKVVKRISRGRYETGSSVIGYINYLNNQIPNKASSDRLDDDVDISDLDKERAKLYKHKAELARLEEEKQKGLLINKYDNDKAMFRLGRIIRNSILSIPARISQPLAAESDHNVVYRILDDELNTALMELSDLDLDEDFPAVDN